MGGYGGGKDVTDSYRRIDVRNLQRRGNLRPGAVSVLPTGVGPVGVEDDSDEVRWLWHSSRTNPGETKGNALANL
jgi:hypothetical protein